MNQKEILHVLILGMDPYLSCGVPKILWDLTVQLTLEIYGQKGVEILESAHKIYDDKLGLNDTVSFHSIEKWEDGGNTEILPEDIIERLGKLPN
jgi:hypothetical protein